MTLTLIVLGSLLFIANPEPARAGYEHNVYQWIWSENIGWFSLNMVTSYGPEGDIDPRDYGLNIDYEARTVEGLAWSNNTGWICFGQDCEEFDWQGAIDDLGYGISAGNWCWNPPGDQDEPDIEYEETGENVRKVTQGWARITNLAIYGKAKFGSDDWGWVSLTHLNTNPAVQYWVQIDLISRLLEGWAWSGTAGDPNQGQGGYGWIAFRYAPVTVDTGTIEGEVTDAATEDKLDGIKIYAYVYEAETGPPAGPGKYELTDVKYGTYTITAFDHAGDYSPFSKPVTLDEPTKTVDFKLYKAIPEECDKKISGFVYYDKNANNKFDGDDQKYGGAHVLIPGTGQYFFPTPANGEYTTTSACEGIDYTIISWYTDGVLELYGTISVVATATPITNANVPLKKGITPQITGPWLQTWWSDVRAERAIDMKATPAPGYANATYLITAADKIEQFFPWQGIGWRKAKYPVPGEPLGFPTEDVSVFSPIDIDRLTVDPTTKPLISPLNANDLDGQGDGVWHINGDLVLKGGDFDEGAKTIIVDGNLTISEDVIYESDLFTPENLPSVGFIVRGNVTVEPEVEHIVGAFYVDKDKDGNGPPVAGVVTIDSTEDKETERQFLCEGLMVAREFKFERVIRDSDLKKAPGYGWDIIGSGDILLRHYGAGEAPSEVIWYDSRVVVNTPKGFEDFSQALPVWEEAP